LRGESIEQFLPGNLSAQVRIVAIGGVSPGKLVVKAAKFERLVCPLFHLDRKRNPEV
jgi:hypothetical protein